LLKHLYPHFPAHESCVEAFAGGAAALMMRYTPAPLEVLNDVDDELVRLYRCLRHHLDDVYLNALVLTETEDSNA
jgi:DNA adenine methylase